MTQYILLSYEDFKQKYYNRPQLSEEEKADLASFHPGFDLDSEVEKIIKEEYELYKQRINAGLEE